MRLETDLLDLLEACVDGTLSRQTPRWKPGSAVCVIAASGGYPGPYATGKPVHGLAEAGRDAMVFHAGTRLVEGAFVTSGGRVLGVTSAGADLAEARALAYRAAGRLAFEGMHFRTDIGIKGLTP